MDAYVSVFFGLTRTFFPFSLSLFRVANQKLTIPVGPLFRSPVYEGGR